MLRKVTPADLYLFSRSGLSIVLSQISTPCSARVTTFLQLSNPHLHFTCTAFLFTHPVADKGSCTTCVCLFTPARFLLFQPTCKLVHQQQIRLQNLPKSPFRAPSGSWYRKKWRVNHLSHPSKMEPQPILQRLPPQANLLALTRQESAFSQHRSQKWAMAAMLPT